jgi:alkylation response protein AidB-like acyl-CoA dehydrogenase
MPLNLKGIAFEKDDADWKRLARHLSTQLLAPNAARIDREALFPNENLKAMGEAGLMGLTVPKEKGGPGGTIKALALVIEELAQGCASTAMCYTMHMSGLLVIAALVQERQIDEFLNPIVAGERLLSFAMSEPGSGNRLWHMDSYAQKDAGDYIIDSFKSFATSTGHADFYLVPVRANSEADPNDLSLFLIDGKDPNVKPVGKWDGLGIRGNSSTPVHFDKCRVPAFNRLGTETCGFSTIFAYSLPVYQVGLSSLYLGIAQAAYDATVAHVKKRVHSDTGLAMSNLETVQRYIAEMKLSIDQTRHLIYRVAQLSDNALALFDELAKSDLLDQVVRANPNDPFFIELAEIKTSACGMAIEVTNKAFQVCGGTAYRHGHPVERHLRDARAGSVMAPSDDTLKLIMGRQILGLEQPWQ